MDAVDVFMLTVAAIFVIGIVGEIMFERTGIPDVIWLILVGIFIGPISGLVTPQQLARVAPYFGAITLVVVLFDGGSELKLKELSHAAPRSLLLALISFALSVIAVAAVVQGMAWIGWFAESWTFVHSLIVGSIVGGSSSVVIMPALKKAGLSPQLSNLINVESALTDVLCVVAAATFIDIAAKGDGAAGNVGEVLGKSFGIGLGLGLLTGVLSLLVLRPLRKSQHAYPVILGTLLILYVVINSLDGSAPLGIIAVAVIVGNAPLLSKTIGLVKTAKLGRGVENAHDQITFIVKSFFFTFIGAMLGPPWSLLGIGVFLGLLLLAARIPAVFLGTAGSHISKPAKQIVLVSMPRGMAAGVLAMMPHQAGVTGTKDLPVVVFACVFTTIVVFAAGFPILKKRLVRLDPGSLFPTNLAPGTPADASVTYGYDNSHSQPPASQQPQSEPPQSEPPQSEPPGSEPQVPGSTDPSDPPIGA